MTALSPAPDPSPTEQAVIDRSGIFAAEEHWEQRVEAAARAMAASDAACEAAPEWHEMSDHLQDNWMRRAAAALTADAPLAGQHTTDEDGPR